MPTMKLLTAADLLAAAGSLVVLPTASASAPSPCEALSGKAATQAEAGKLAAARDAECLKALEAKKARADAHATPDKDARAKALARAKQVRVLPHGAPETGDGSLAG
ncbi:hypothetical protein [Amycolatopsis sacchari]|uniref:hypothetical protein n=1 Tax=Amycolatopsis sacchari TaxID=115433 RepID=UPI003EBBFBCE